MPLPIITDTIRVAIEGHVTSGHKFAHVLHVRKSGALTVAGTVAIVDPLIDRIWTVAPPTPGPLTQSLLPTWGIDRVRYTPLDGVSATTISPRTLVGVTTGDPLPSQVALVVSFYTARRGRSYRGRLYGVGWLEGDNTSSGTPQATLVARWNQVWTRFIADLVGTGVTQVVASYLHQTAENVISANVDPRWDTQRRRLNV